MKSMKEKKIFKTREYRKYSNIWKYKRYRKPENVKKISINNWELRKNKKLFKIEEK